MSETPKTKNPEQEKGSETLTESLYALSQESPREFARTWQSERGNAKLGLPELEEFFREKFVEQGGENPDLTEMSEANKRMLYSLRAEGNELGFIFNQLGGEARANPDQAKSLTQFIKEQDARASQQHDHPPLQGDDYTEWILESFEDTSVESSTQTPPVEDLGDIQSRLNPKPSEPLSRATKEDFFTLSRTADQTFQEKLDRLDNEQQKEVRAYVAQSYENLKVAEMSPEDRKQYFAAQKEKQAKEQEAVADEARQDALEVAVAQEPTSEASPEVKARRENPQTEEDYLLLHSLKLTDGVQFKDVYGKLTAEQRVKFDAREAREDAHVMAAAPDFLVPRLSRNGEWTSMSGPKPKSEDGSSGGEIPVRDGSDARLFNREYQPDEGELKELAAKATSTNPDDRKAYADAVKEMPIEKLTALNKYRSENQPESQESGAQPDMPVDRKIERRIEGPLDMNYLRSMYKNAHSNDPRLREAFANESRGWDAVERNQYVQYSATAQTGLAEQERQQPQAKPGALRRLWNRRPWGKKKK